MDERDNEKLEPQEQREDHHARNELLEEQEHKGYGEDEGERDESFPE
jgi:hypothetical protein